METVQDEFNKFLCDANLLMFKNSFISKGVERVCDVMDLSDDTLRWLRTAIMFQLTILFEGLLFLFRESCGVET